MKDGYLKAIFILLLGFNYIGATYAITGFYMKQNELKPITNFDECFWNQLDKQDFLSMSENQRMEAVVVQLKHCDTKYKLAP